jgi:hypothetical protein
MPKLRPLEQWYCDNCGEIVEIDDGWLEWLESIENGPRSFRIVHNRDKCFHHTRHNDRADNHLEYFLGNTGMQWFLAKLDVGVVLDSKAENLPALPDIRSYVDTFRRLHLPYYEEARQYFHDAISDGYFDGANEVFVHLPETSKDIIHKYGKP